MRALFVTHQFEKDLSKIPKEIRDHADTILPLVRENPLTQNLNIKKLKGFVPSVYRVRIGSYRLMYSFTQNSLTLHRIAHRKDIYRN